MKGRQRRTEEVPNGNVYVPLGIVYDWVGQRNPARRQLDGNSVDSTGDGQHQWIKVNEDLGSI